ncbi:MAG: type IV toxin-antitoxin system AbiEi family antitoxin domain-containing protein [Clostridiales Family XIII bacterium]|jgi:hypothetical protein|nr:type IV toxin-antitoxin system AbiEi family antitoxin domain-containing protein [Clostridiales Family XIII bacterium]
MEMKDAIAEILKSNNGVLKASGARLAGIDNKELQRLTDAGLFERVSRGLYISPSDMADEYLVAQYKCGKGVYSHETALYFHNLCDRTPMQLMITIPSGYNTTLLKDKLSYRFFYCKPDIHPIGVGTVLSPHGNELRVYDKERTLCDCIKKKDSLDSDLVLSAVKQYMRESGNDFAKLLSYAEILKIRDKVRQYMEVLI